jgi:amino acid transporter
MDSPTHSNKLDDRKETSDPINGPDPDSDLKQPSETALPAELISAGSQHLHRKLRGKEIQLFAVGGAIGTCMEFSNSLKGFLIRAPFTAA